MKNHVKEEEKQRNRNHLEIEIDRKGISFPTSVYSASVQIYDMRHGANHFVERGDRDAGSVLWKLEWRIPFLSKVLVVC